MLTRKTFLTKDSKGCEFKCECYLVRNWKGDKPIESHYYGMGIEAKTLKELKEKVGELPQ